MHRHGIAELAAHRVGECDHVDLLAFGAQALGARHTALRVLGLFECRIGPEGGAELAGALEHNRTLQILLLSDNRLADRGGMAFASALGVNQSLRKLWLRNNGLSESTRSALAAACGLARGGRGRSVLSISLLC